MDGKDIVKLSADLASGAITQQYISEKYGNGVLGLVLGIGSGVVAGIATNVLLDTLDDHTGVVSDVGGLIDDVLDLF